MTMYRRLIARMIFNSFLVFGLAAIPMSATGQNLAISGYGGYTTDPGGFDVFSQTEFDRAFHIGGSVGIRVGSNIAVRGDFLRAWSSGRETGVLDEPVNFDRTYYGVAVKIRFPVTGITPYILGGAGYVSVYRSAPSQSYSFSELAGSYGAGISYRVENVPVELFAEASQWAYGRVSTGQGTQFDTHVSLGFNYIPQL